MEERDNDALEFFRSFIRIKTVTYDGPVTGAYQEAVHLLEVEAQKRGFKTTVYQNNGKPILLCTKDGSDSSLPAILLNNHYDVVPADESKWSMGSPFSADVKDECVIGRGTQDMKSVTVQQMEGLFRATINGPLLRTVHITCVPDEEIGGVNGLGSFVKTDDFKQLNIGCALDEGLANPNKDEYTVFYGERCHWWITIKAIGPTGHGSRFIKNTATQRLINAINKFLEYRAEQELLFEGHGCKHGVAHKLGDVVSINCTMLKAGVLSGTCDYALNVIPTEAEAGFDIRIPPHIDIHEFEKLVHSWIDPNEITIKFHGGKMDEHSVSPIDGEWFNHFKDAFNNTTKKIVPEIFPAATDSGYIRALKIPSFGFSPMDNTPILLHDHNERLSINTFKEGINIMTNVITHMANRPE